MNRKLLLSLLIGFISLQWTACNKTDSPAPERAAVSYSDVAYGNNPAQKMDVFLPAGRDTISTPLLILIHGGAWISGDKRDFTPYLDSIRKMLSGYAIANLNYRLAGVGVNPFPTQENDVNNAVKFLLEHTGAYHISQKIVYLGASAGGQLALLQAYKYAIPPATAVISLFGPTDMTDLFYHSPDKDASLYMPLLMGGTPGQNPALYFSSSPINYVSSRSCPTLLFQGGKDKLVPYQEAFRLNDTLQTLGVVHTLVYYPNEGHGWTGANLQDSFEKIKTFLEENIQ